MKPAFQNNALSDLAHQSLFGVRLVRSFSQKKRWISECVSLEYPHDLFDLVFEGTVGDFGAFSPGFVTAASRIRGKENFLCKCECVNCCKTQDIRNLR